MVYMDDVKKFEAALAELNELYALATDVENRYKKVVHDVWCIDASPDKKTGDLDSSTGLLNRDRELAKLFSPGLFGGTHWISHMTVSAVPSGIKWTSETLQKMLDIYKTKYEAEFEEK